MKGILGYLPQEPDLYPSLSVSEFLDYVATLKNLHRAPARLRAVEQVVLGNPKLLIVDEPTAGLDPEERVRFRNLLAC